MYIDICRFCTQLTRHLAARLLLLYAILLSGCATSDQIKYFSVPDLTADSFASFAIENTSDRDGPIYGMLNNGIQKVFSDKGYEYSNGQEPDMLVRYMLLVERGTRLVEHVIPTGKGTLTQQTMEPVNEAKFLVNIVDKNSGKVVWKASTVKDITGVSTPTQDELNARLADFFDNFPEKL